MDVQSLLWMAIVIAPVAITIGWRWGSIYTSLVCGLTFGYLFDIFWGRTIGIPFWFFDPTTWLPVMFGAALGAAIPAWFYRSPDAAAIAKPARPNWGAGAKSSRNLFLSYRRSDSRDITGRIYDRLVQEFGRTAVFRDVDSIPIGTDFRQHIDGMLTRCNVCLVVIGNDWKSARDDKGNTRLLDPRDHVRIEIETALKRNIPVVPVLVAGASIPSQSELPDTLQDLVFRNAIHVRSDPDFHRDVDRLVAGLQELKA